MSQVSRQISGRRAARARRRAAVWFAIAAVLALLGAGNVAYGNWKATQYTSILLKNSAPPDQYSKRIGATIEFYEVVIFGGRSLLGVAGLALVFGLLAKRQGRSLSRDA